MTIGVKHVCPGDVHQNNEPLGLSNAVRGLLNIRCGVDVPGLHRELRSNSHCTDGPRVLVIFYSTVYPYPHAPREQRVRCGTLLAIVTHSVSGATVLWRHTCFLSSCGDYGLAALARVGFGITHDLRLRAQLTDARSCSLTLSPSSSNVRIPFAVTTGSEVKPRNLELKISVRPEARAAKFMVNGAGRVQS